MKLTFNVHSSEPADFAVKVSFNGKEIDATVTGLVVELVSEDGSMSQVLRLTEDVEAMRALFVTDGSVTATYTKDKG